MATNDNDRKYTISFFAYTEVEPFLRQIKLDFMKSLQDMGFPL